jgi:hypothetical protein
VPIPHGTGVLPWTHDVRGNAHHCGYRNRHEGRELIAERQKSILTGLFGDEKHRERDRRDHRQSILFGCGRKSHMLNTAPSRRGMHDYTQSR